MASSCMCSEQVGVRHMMEKSLLAFPVIPATVMGSYKLNHGSDDALAKQRCAIGWVKSAGLDYAKVKSKLKSESTNGFALVPEQMDGGFFAVVLISRCSEGAYTAFFGDSVE